MLDAFYYIFGKGHGIHTVRNEPCYSVWALGEDNIKSQVHHRKQVCRSGMQCWEGESLDMGETLYFLPNFVVNFKNNKHIYFHAPSSIHQLEKNDQ